MREEQSPAETYAEILMNNKEPAYYAQVPSSIFYCTYIDKDKDGNHERKKLSSNAIALYTLIRSVAGTKSACWMNTKNLAEMLGRGTGTVSEAKRELQMPMEQLGGKPLIKVETKNKRHCTGSTRYHSITVEFIWPENNAFMATRKHWISPDVHNTTALSDSESEGEALSDSESASPGTSSDSETNNRSLQKKNPPVKTEPPSDAGQDCSSIDGYSVIEAHEEIVSEVTRELSSFGCDNNFINEMLRRFTPLTIKKALTYTHYQLQRKRMPNRFGYLRNAIENSRVWNHSIG